MKPVEEDMQLGQLRYHLTSGPVEKGIKSGVAKQ